MPKGKSEVLSEKDGGDWAICSDPNMGLDQFREAVRNLDNPEVLTKVKEEYATLEGHTRGSVAGILKAVLRYEGSPTYNWRSIQFALNDAVDSHQDASEWIKLYQKVCSMLEIHFSFAIPYLSFDPAHQKVKGELSRLKFVMRGSSGSINLGLLNDKGTFTDFMQSKHGSIIQTLSNSQISASLDTVGLKTPEQLKALFNSARVVRTPPNTEVIIYYAGHGQEGSGNCVP